MTTEAELSPAALERLEDELYRRVLRRVVRMAVIGTAVFTAVTTLALWLAWATLRDRVLEEAVATVQNDTTLRANLLAGLDLDTAALRARLLESFPQLVGQPGGSPGLDAADLQALLDRLLRDSAGQGTPAGPVRSLRH